MKNTLTIQNLATVKVGNRVFFWVKLSTETEIRDCCFTRYYGVWQHEDGEKEPAMSKALRDLFHGKKGNAALNKAYKLEKGDSVTLEA